MNAKFFDKKRIFPRSLITLWFTALLFLFSSTALARIHKEAEPDQLPPAPQVKLNIVEQNIMIDGKPVNIYSLVQPDGTFGLVATKGQMLDLILKNNTHVPAAIHMYGLIMPNNQDGAPFVTQKPLFPGEEFHFKFPLIQSGTFWLNSHYKLQQQQLMAAPLIVRDPNEGSKYSQDYIMFLQDFIFRNPKEAYVDMRQQLKQKLADVQLPSQYSQDDPTKTQQIAMDAYLTNHRTLANPDIFRVMPGSLTRLRIINAAVNTNFIVDLGNLTGRIIAADSEAVEPVNASKFQLGPGQRLDLEIEMPPGDNYYPILAQAEGTNKLTGLILTTPNAIAPTKISETTNHIAPALDYSQETALKALYPLLPQSVNRSYTVNITGNMLSYIWTMNNEVWPNVTPLKVKENERVEVVLNNKTEIPIAIHLHGHVFQVVEVKGEKIRGAMRDTVLVLPLSTVKIQFDAENPGVWLLQGNIPFLPYGGMATLISYEGYALPVFNQKDTGVPPQP